MDESKLLRRKKRNQSFERVTTEFNHFPPEEKTFIKSQGVSYFLAWHSKIRHIAVLTKSKRHKMQVIGFHIAIKIDYLSFYYILNWYSLLNNLILNDSKWKNNILYVMHILMKMTQKNPFHYFELYLIIIRRNLLFSINYITLM